MRSAIGLLALCFAGCAHTDSVSILVAPASTTLIEGKALRESVGIETLGGVFTPLLAKGCEIPCSRSQTFSTAEDGQGQISVHLYRGDSPMVKAAQSLGQFQIAGFAPARRGEPAIAVKFEVDAEGVTLSATDTSGGSRLSIARIE
ncbi:Hsp70 family protein [Lysobacter sp. cf310]|uniref:Hsp70 family protein n=1 Tax=Lysobacter sp. cf310 TaxID=1761790 RepID=UPI000AD301FA|nr:Hsp70 family protein [Lysobacter sp. cf310]